MHGLLAFEHMRAVLSSETRSLSSLWCTPTLNHVQLEGLAAAVEEAAAAPEHAALSEALLVVSEMETGLAVPRVQLAAATKCGDAARGGSVCGV